MLSPMRAVTGVGLGLRWEFLGDLLRDMPASIPFLEISPENYMRRGGYHREALGRLMSAYPMLTHGLTMSLGGIDPLDETYLAELRSFLAEVRAPWHSDHLCFGSVGGRMLHDLLPIGFTEAAVLRVSERIERAQDALGLPLAIENISFYLHPGKKQMGEAEFIARVCERADCLLMLDVNNAYVNATNFGFDVDEWMRTVPLHRVVQMHIAGHDWVPEDELIIDTHGADVPDPVLALFERVLPKTGPVPVVLERDQRIPPFTELLAELAKIRAVYERATKPVLTAPRRRSSGSPSSSRGTRRRAHKSRTHSRRR
jgi:uncharacterized protein (UPF0276 family)